MAREGNTAILAPSNVDNLGHALSEEGRFKRPRIDSWGTSLPRWSPPDESWVFGYGLTNERRLNGWGQLEVIGPHRLYSTWFAHNNGAFQFPVPIECAEFPNISDEDLWWLLRVIEHRHHFNQPRFDPDHPFTEGESELYRASIVLASQRALDGLDA